MDERARIDFLRRTPYCMECGPQGYMALARVVDFETEQALCLRCHNDLVKARQEAAEAAEAAGCGS